MVKSTLFSLIFAALAVLGAGFFVNNWFLNGYNMLWIAIPSFWLGYQIFSRIFKILDIIIAAAIVTIIIILAKNGIIFS